MTHQPIISPNLRIRHPDSFIVGEGSIVDDFSYFSTRVTVGRYCHIASGCTIAGGVQRLFTLGDFSSLSSGVRVWCTSDDFVRDVVTILPDACGEVKENLISGDVTLERLTAVGANSVIMPRNHLPEGTVVGALSFVPPEYPFEAWGVYAGSPVRFIKPRDRDSVLRQLDAIQESLARESSAQCR